ncbi:MAG: sulfite exporter TauE/SafE family protein [Solirubrobacteraceae bacterium]
MISTLDSAALVLAGTAAGLIGSAGGITSLVSYPALLAVGLPALPANVANNVALVGCWPGSALASKPELHGRASWLRRWTVVAVAGGAAGAVLLLLTPSGVFAHVVPLLVAAGSLALLLEPQLTAWRQRYGGEQHRPALAAGLAALSVYNGYFGAGSGVMILTLLLVLVDRDLPSANALKNMLIGAASAVSAVIFTLWGSVDWSAAVPLGIGMLAGSRVGPLVARRLPATVLRWLIVALGMALAIDLWLHPRA